MNEDRCMEIDNSRLCSQWPGCCLSSLSGICAKFVAYKVHRCKCGVWILRCGMVF